MNGKVIAALLYLFISGPIWFYLFYKILKAVNASELMMFLFWIYVPVTFLAGVILKLAEKD